MKSQFRRKNSISSHLHWLRLVNFTKTQDEEKSRHWMFRDAQQVVTAEDGSWLNCGGRVAFILYLPDFWLRHHGNLAAFLPIFHFPLTRDSASARQSTGREEQSSSQRPSATVVFSVTNQFFSGLNSASGLLFHWKANECWPLRYAAETKSCSTPFLSSSSHKDQSHFLPTRT